jgi:hypothetical protein
MGGTGYGTELLSSPWKKSEETNGIILDHFVMSKLDMFFKRIAVAGDILITNPAGSVVAWSESYPQNFCRIPELVPEYQIAGQRISEQVITFLCTKAPEHFPFAIVSKLTLLAQNVFDDSFVSMSFEVTSDPELEDEEHLAINICLEGSPAEALSMYTRFRKRLAIEFSPETYRLLAVDLDLI